MGCMKSDLEAAELTFHVHRGGGGGGLRNANRVLLNSMILLKHSMLLML